MKILIVTSLLWNSLSYGQIDYRAEGRLSPSDYLLKSQGKMNDAVFDSYREIDANVDLGVSSSCGQIDMKSTLRAALKNILDTKYMGDMGKNVLAASPMLAMCYFSPTWCAIVKNARLQANLLAGVRLDQCRAIDKYVDSRSQDYEKERQDCVRQNIKSSGGDFERALDACGGNAFEKDLASWDGLGKAKENRLLTSSAKWAGLKGKDADETVKLVTALVGDSVVKKGRFSVDFGEKNMPVTPRTHLLALENATYKSLCIDLMTQRGRGRRHIESSELIRISGGRDPPLIDIETVRGLLVLPPTQRDIYCRKLSDGISLSLFTDDMNRSLDFLSAYVETNPNLPDHRRLEAQIKRERLKEQIQMTLVLNKHKNGPLNETLSDLSAASEKRRGRLTSENLNANSLKNSQRLSDSQFFDCSDRIMCQ